MVGTEVLTPQTFTHTTHFPSFASCQRWASPSWPLCAVQKSFYSYRPSYTCE